MGRGLSFEYSLLPGWLGCILEARLPNAVKRELESAPQTLMAPDPETDSNAARTVALASRISQWLAAAGVKDPSPTFAVGLADSVAAFEHITHHLTLLLETNPRIPEQADKAVTHLGAIAAWYFGEAKDHMLELEASWDSLEATIAGLGAQDDEEYDS